MKEHPPGTLFDPSELAYAHGISHLIINHDDEIIAPDGYGVHRGQIVTFTKISNECVAFVICTTNQKTRNNFYYLITPHSTLWIESELKAHDIKKTIHAR